MGNFVVGNIAGKNIAGNDWPIPPTGNYVGPVELLGLNFTNFNPWANFRMP
jgi:hypothetical protein